VVGWLSCSAGLQPTAALAQGTRTGRPFVTGDGSLYYEHGATMLGPLAVFGILFAALLPDREEGNGADGDYGEYGPGWCETDAVPALALEAYQLGSSAAVFVTPHLAAGLRLVAQGNDRRDPVDRFWGFGPEVTAFPGPAASPLRPFLGLSGLYVRGRVAKAVPSYRLTGALCQLRTGLSWLGAGGGFFVQASCQGRPMDRRHDLAQTRAGWGAGMGFVLYPASL
jgi:hypothetical protein